MIVNKCSENLLKKSKKLYENYRDNCTVVQRMLEKYKKIYPNISDYSIMHFIDIAEFCDLIMDRKKLEGLNEDECYCLLLAALFAHTGFGLNQEIMNRYINRLGIQKQTQSLTFLQIMSKYHVLFSACLIEEYGDIFEFPSEKHKHAITSMLYFIGGNSDDINQLEESTPVLTITKSVSPVPVTENGTLTYTFLIQNSGNVAADASTGVVVTDVFDPVLSNISVTFNQTAWSSPANYSYNETTGAFATNSGQITVPAATFTRDEVTGVWNISPGISTLVVTGTI